jgi:sterol desaturase/sphingolipid hydroxylase (fatty acid hydroxylase superfamily)
MQRNYKSVQVFENPLLEKFTHSHPATPFVLWIPFVGWLLWRSVYVLHLNFSVLSTLAVGGLFGWTFLEYFLHRFVFHYEGTHPWSQRLHFLIHGIHHVDPNDPTRLVMPPAGGIILASLLFVFLRFLLGDVLAQPFFAFMLIGYLFYDFTHFAVHHFRPRTGVGKMLKHHHMQHHFVNPNSRWGVSSPLWDFVFGTLDSEVLEGKMKDEESTV